MQQRGQRAGDGPAEEGGGGGEGEDKAKRASARNNEQNVTTRHPLPNTHALTKSSPRRLRVLTNVVELMETLRSPRAHSNMEVSRLHSRSLRLFIGSQQSLEIINSGGGKAKAKAGEMDVEGFEEHGCKSAESKGQSRQENMRTHEK